MGRSTKEIICRGSFIKFPWEGADYQDLPPGTLGAVVYLFSVYNQQLSLPARERILIDPIYLQPVVNDWVTRDGSIPKYIYDEINETCVLVEGVIKLGETNYYPIAELDPETNKYIRWEATEESLTQDGRILLSMLRSNYPEDSYQFIFVTAEDT